MKDKNLLDKSSGVKDSVSGNEHIEGLIGKVALVGFEVLDESEQDVVKKMVESYIKKMSTVGTYKEMKISLRQHKHGKTFKHEVNALAIFGQGEFQASVTEWNLYIALSMVCDKILAEVQHKAQKFNAA